jgi:hypothetical protein
MARGKREGHFVTPKIAREFGEDGSREERRSLRDPKDRSRKALEEKIGVCVFCIEYGLGKNYSSRKALEERIGFRVFALELGKRRTTAREKHSRRRLGWFAREFGEDGSREERRSLRDPKV